MDGDHIMKVEGTEIPIIVWSLKNIRLNLSLLFKQTSNLQTRLFNYYTLNNEVLILNII